MHFYLIPHVCLITKKYFGYSSIRGSTHNYKNMTKIAMSNTFKRKFYFVRLWVQLELVLKLLVVWWRVVFLYLHTLKRIVTQHVWDQGDQMRSWKNRSKYQTYIIHKFYHGKNCPNIWASSVIKKLPKGNNRPIDEKSPNLAILSGSNATNRRDALL
jgi:hypothetical protein